MTQADSSIVLYTYDAAHRVQGIEDGLGNRIQYTLDALGNHTAESVYDPSAVLARTQSQVFNNLSQPWKRVGAACGHDNIRLRRQRQSDDDQTTISAPLGRQSINA